MSGQPSSVIKYGSFVVLTLQTTLTLLVMRYSRTQITGSKDKYIITTCILVSELVKMMSCLVILLIQKSGSFKQWSNTLYSEIVLKPVETAKLIIPSSLLTIQSIMILSALSSLDAATFQVTYQFEIIAYACFSFILLRKTIRPLQGLAFVILMAGVVLVQLSSEKSKTLKSDNTNIQQTEQTVTIHHQYTLGITGVLTSAISGSFVSVYYEKFLKGNSQSSAVIRNIQLGSLSIIFCLVGMVIKNDFGKIVERGFFDGYTAVVWFVILLQAGGGLALAAIIKYSGQKAYHDNMLKDFSASVSIVLTGFVSSSVFHDLELDLIFILGAGQVILGIFLHGAESNQITPEGQRLPVDESVIEKVPVP